MTRTAEATPRPADGRSSLAIDNLRAVVILLVLAFHSALAYLQFLPHHPFSFSGSAFAWRAFPVVDQHRWIGFDLFCAWLDVFLMSFFFLLSGLFAWPSLMRRGAGPFLADRIMRLGLPFVAVVLVLMPVTQYPTYLQTAAHPSVAEYWREWRALPIWPSGPMWFLWLLLAGDIALAGLYQALAGRRDLAVRVSQYARARPGRFLSGVMLASAVGYVSLALRFGTQGWFQVGPFAFQYCRPLHYAVYFFAGVAIGACGIERGLVAPDGPLARHWRRWLAAAPPLFLMWAGLTGLTLREGAAAPFALQLADDLSYALACFASCFMAFALAVRFGRRPLAILDRLKGNVYGMYLVHYGFVVWLQYALLGVDAPAIVKWAFVFAATVLLSWGATEALGQIPPIARVIGASRRPAAKALRPAPARRHGGAAGLVRR